MKKMPPVEKVYEALGAIADGRVAMVEGGAEVVSSGGGKRYAVRWDGDVYSANDSATYWQMYPGYPIIAVLMLQGKLPCRQELAAHLAGVRWDKLNARHKRKYAAAVAEVLDGLRGKEVDTAAIERHVADVFAGLERLDIVIKRGSLRPPKSLE